MVHLVSWRSAKSTLKTSDGVVGELTVKPEPVVMGIEAQPRDDARRQFRQGG